MKSCELVRGESLHNLSKCFWLGSFFEGEGTSKNILFLIDLESTRVFREVFSSRDLKSFRYLIFHLASIQKIEILIMIYREIE